jgi:hypothetical protein
VAATLRGVKENDGSVACAAPLHAAGVRSNPKEAPARVALPGISRDDGRKLDLPDHQSELAAFVLIDFQYNFS